jgi:hypothetical protein
VVTLLVSSPPCSLRIPFVSLPWSLDGYAASLQEGYHLCFISAFDMNNWKRCLRGKLPFGELQPVQVCGTLMQVAHVMKEGLPKDTMDDDLGKMDRLADML